MKLPIKPVDYSEDVLKYPNGEIPQDKLIQVGKSGYLWNNAARSFLAMQAAAATVGIYLTYTYGGCFRSYKGQKSLFLSRYIPKFVAGKTYAFFKRWQGKKWYKLLGMATAAVPGTSNHGRAIAIDLALGTSPDNAVPLNDKALKWLLKNAHLYGFSWELQSEPWHVRYVLGDALPAATVEYERRGSKPVTPPVTPVTPPPSGDGTPELSMGSTGDYVKKAQKKLADAGFYKGPIDGDFGGMTKAAVINFQTKNKLVVDGLIGDQTWAVLMKVSKPTPPPKIQSLKVGSKGERVKAIQKKLNSLGFNVGPADGDFGEKTKRGVMDFQRAYKLLPDGVVGPKTQAAIDRLDPKSKVHSYTVVQGDSYWRIAEKTLGDGAKFEAIQKANSNVDLHPGKVISIPGANATVVVKGDTYRKIAKRLGKDYKYLMARNKWQGKVLLPGQVIWG